MANEIDAERIANKISLAAAKTDEALNSTYKQISILLTVFENIVSSIDDFQVKAGSLNVTLTETTVTSNQMAQHIGSLADSVDQAAESVGDINNKMALNDIKEYTESLSKVDDQLKKVAKSEKSASEATKEHVKSKNDVVKMTDAAVDALGNIISMAGAGSTQISSLVTSTGSYIFGAANGSGSIYAIIYSSSVTNGVPSISIETASSNNPLYSTDHYRVIFFK